MKGNKERLCVSVGERQAEQAANDAELLISEFKFISNRAAFGRNERVFS